MVKINVTKLDQELRAAGVPIDGCSSTGRIDYRPEATDADRARGAAVLAAHDPGLSAEQLGEAAGGLPPRVLAALVLRLSSSWPTLTAARRAWVQGVLDAAAVRIQQVIA